MLKCLWFAAITRSPLPPNEPVGGNGGYGFREGGK